MPVQNDTHLILPVCLWESSPKLGFSQEQLFGDPLLIAAPRKDCTYDVLYQLVLHRLQRCIRMPDDNSSWWNMKARRISNGGKYNLRNIFVHVTICYHLYFPGCP
jgi:ubiquitin carboxyl-terminal hydrolase 4/11/15